MIVALAMPAALTYGLQTEATAALLQGVDHRGHDASTTGRKRVSDGDGTPLTLVRSRMPLRFVSTSFARLRINFRALR